MKQTEIAWCAGFFDGEGSISFGGKRHGLAIYVSQKEPDALSRFSKTFPGGKIRKQDLITRIGNQTYIHTYQQCGLNAAVTLSYLLPFLTVKKEHALKAIRYQSSKRPKRPNYSAHITDAIRMEEIYNLHNEGKSFAAIGRLFNISRQRASQIYTYMDTSKLRQIL